MKNVRNSKFEQISIGVLENYKVLKDFTKGLYIKYVGGQARGFLWGP